MLDLAALNDLPLLWALAMTALLHELGIPLPLSPAALFVGARVAAGAVDPVLPVAAIVAATLIGNAVVVLRWASLRARTVAACRPRAVQPRDAVAVRRRQPWEMGFMVARGRSLRSGSFPGRAAARWRARDVLEQVSDADGGGISALRHRHRRRGHGPASSSRIHPVIARAIWRICAGCRRNRPDDLHDVAMAAAQSSRRRCPRRRCTSGSRPCSRVESARAATGRRSRSLCGGGYVDFFCANARDESSSAGAGTNGEGWSLRQNEATIRTYVGAFATRDQAAACDVHCCDDSAMSDESLRAP